MQLSEDICRYWDMRSDGFSDAVLHELGTRGEEVSREVAGRLGVVPGSRVLDVGCGPGFLSILLAQRGASVTGIDMSEMMVRRARENAGNFGLDIDFRVMDAQKMDFWEGSFDAVVSRSVMWGLTEPERAYSEMVRVLKAGGRGYVSDGNFYRRLFDPRYEFVRGEDASGHERFNRGGVDFGIMERIAEDLPLSRADRPQWDFGALCQLDVSDIDVRIFRRPNVSGVRTIAGFSAVFSKGGN